jgi:hypothetical protein
MKLYKIQNTCFIITIFSIYLISCGQNLEKTNTDNETITIDTIESKNDYDLSNDFLTRLRTTDVDTIIFYKRTCIGCCDYFNVFWIKNGKINLNKYYFDFNDMKTHSVEIELFDNTIFTTVFDNFTELKKNPIKENIHENGNSLTSFKSHYCYTQLKIYLDQDSLITNRIIDHYFDEFTNFNKVQNDDSKTNDNYQENIDSEWNNLLTLIETQLSVMVETSEKELETLRIR